MSFIAMTHAAWLATLALTLTAYVERPTTSPAVTPTPAASATASTSVDDAYDLKRMDSKPRPAVFSNERHSGPFASGTALGLDTMLKPLLPASVKKIRLDNAHKITEIAPGVKFSAWTFGDQVPALRFAPAPATSSSS